MPCSEKSLGNVLLLFEERFLELLDSQFYKIFKAEGKSVSISFDPEQPFPPRFIGPREKDCVDFMVLMRSFLPSEPDELVSVKHLRSLYSSSKLPASLKERFEALYKQFERFHNGLTPITLGNDRITRRKLFSVFAYGSRIHIKPSQRAVYERWKNDGNLFALLESTLLDLLLQYVDFLARFFQINSEAISCLGLKRDTKD